MKKCKYWPTDDEFFGLCHMGSEISGDGKPCTDKDEKMCENNKDNKMIILDEDDGEID
jgi:hypothetical protein